MAENKGDGGSEPSERQRFYVELKYGETTIVSWKKLLKQAKKKKKEEEEEKKGQCSVLASGPHSSLSVDAPEILRKNMDVSYDAGQCNDSVIGKETIQHVATSLDNMQLSKHRVEMPKIDGEKNDDPSIKLAGPKGMNAKVISKTKNMYKHSSSPAMVKDHLPEKSRASMVNEPVLTYSRKSADFKRKFKGPPLNAVEDVCVFPSKAMHNVVEKNQKISSEKSRTKAGVGDYSDVTHQKIEGSSRVKIGSMSGKLLHDAISSSRHLNDKSGGSRESINGIPWCYKPPLKDSKAEKFKAIKNEIFAMVHNKSSKASYIPVAKVEPIFPKTYNLDGKMEDKLCEVYELCFQGLTGDKDEEVQKLCNELADVWPKGFMDNYKLTEAISRAKYRKAIAAKIQAKASQLGQSMVDHSELHRNQGQPMVEAVRTKHVRPPCQKRKVTDSSNSYNSSPPLIQETAPKKAAREPPALQLKSSEPLTKVGKLTLAQKQLVPPMTNLKVRFHLKQEHETLKPDDKPVNDDLNQ